MHNIRASALSQTYSSSSQHISQQYQYPYGGVGSLHEEGSQMSHTVTTGASNSVKPQIISCCTIVWSLPGTLWTKAKEGFLAPISDAFLSNSYWRTGLVIGNFILLFGSPIQILLIPPAGDRACDIIYTLVLVAFIVDIMCRAIVVAGYFRVTAGRIYKPSPNCLVYCWQWIGNLRFPSFLFFCDLLSTMTLVYDISFFNPDRFELTEMNFDLTAGTTLENGRPGFFDHEAPIELPQDLLVTIFKTARVVRFVRSQAVSTLISRVNWYWPLQCLSAILSFFDCGCYGGTRNHHSDDSPEGPERGGPGPAMSIAPKKDPGRQGGRDRNELASSKTSTATAGLTGVEAYQDNRRNSWGGVGLATLASLKAHQRAQEVENERNKGFWGGIKKLLRDMGFTFGDQPQYQHHLAATKIQRAWRRTVARRRNSDLFQDELNLSSIAESGPAQWTKSSVTKKKHVSKKLLPSSLRNLSDATGIPARISQKLKYAAGGEWAAESQVGGAMRELTGQRVAIGILVALLFTATFTYVEQDTTRPATMIILHAQTTGTYLGASPAGGISTATTSPPQAWIDTALRVARKAAVPDLYQFDIVGGSNPQNKTFPVVQEKVEDLREREKLRIMVMSTKPNEKAILTSVGWFAYREERVNEALVQLTSTIFILLLWLFGVTAFAGPVMVLVVLPIERMVRLLGMLMVDPLGYQSTSRYRKFVLEEDELTKNTRWTKEVLKGMETSFLMSTILRIGSLMKVGFGSAGVEIIRKNLEKKQGGSVNLLTSKGLTVSCIFLFCDVRQFTDATECLQEEVFVFTNRIAAVVHSFCHSFGGSANKNVGDAFLCSWLLDTPPNDGGFGGGDELYAKNNQADKCLLCVVKIIMALHHDNYYIETMSEAPRNRLLAKLANRPGPVVQMGCGLHAGKAVQGAIGSERKIDATYVSEAVEMAEFLESSTKQYGLKMLMSNSFHNLLHSNNRQRCRLVDQIVKGTDDDDDDDEPASMYERDDIIELYTYDMDVDALWKAPPALSKPTDKGSSMDAGSMSDADSRQGVSDRRGELKKALSTQRNPPLARQGTRGMRMSIAGMLTSKAALNLSNSNTSSVQKNVLDGSLHDFDNNSTVLKASGTPLPNADPKENAAEFRKPELILPTGPAPYSPAYWRSDVMFRIRKKYLDGLFFHNYSQGLQSFYNRDWPRATQSFKAILDTFDDGPSRYFMDIIEKNSGKPPPNFRPYGRA